MQKRIRETNPRPRCCFRCSSLFRRPKTRRSARGHCDYVRDLLRVARLFSGASSMHLVCVEVPLLASSGRRNRQKWWPILAPRYWPLRPSFLVTPMLLNEKKGSDRRLHALDKGGRCFLSVYMVSIVVIVVVVGCVCVPRWDTQQRFGNPKCPKMSPSSFIHL